MRIAGWVGVLLLSGCAPPTDLGRPCVLKFADGGVVTAGDARRLEFDRYDVFLVPAGDCDSLLCGRAGGPVTGPDDAPLSGAVCLRHCITVGGACGADQASTGVRDAGFFCRAPTAPSAELLTTGFGVDAGKPVFFCLPR